MTGRIASRMRYGYRPDAFRVDRTLTWTAAADGAGVEAVSGPRAGLQLGTPVSRAEQGSDVDQGRQPGAARRPGVVLQLRIPTSRASSAVPRFQGDQPPSTMGRNHPGDGDSHLLSPPASTSTKSKTELGSGLIGSALVQTGNYGDEDEDHAQQQQDPQTAAVSRYAVFWFSIISPVDCPLNFSRFKCLFNPLPVILAH